MKNKHLLVGRELGRKKWTLKIGAINVAIFGKYAADFGFLALVTLNSVDRGHFLEALVEKNQNRRISYPSWVASES